MELNQSTKKVKFSIFILLLLTSISVGCSNNNNLSTEGVRQVKSFSNNFSVKLSPEEFYNETELIINAIDKFYAHKDRKKIDISYLNSKYLKKAQAAKSMDDFNIILLKLFAELNNSHSRVYTGMSEYGLPITTELIEGKAVVSHVGATQIQDNGVEKGWIVKKIDNKTTLEWMENRYEIISASTPQALTYEALQWIFRRYGHEPAARKYLFVSPKGEELEIELSLNISRDQLNTYQFSPIETNNIGDIGYIAINTMRDGIVEEFDEALEGMLDKKGIILDLRKNGGGNSVNGDRIFQRLIQEETDIWQGRTLDPHKELNYSGELIALIGPETYSAAESFSYDLYDSGRVIIIGEPTRGDSGGGPVLFRTDRNVHFVIPTRGLDYSASGAPMEGMGLEPHIYMEQTYEDFLNDKDTLLDAAQKIILEL